jgi:hypothetical protein
MTPFIDGNIWSVFHDEFNPEWFYVHRVYYYNSLNDDPNTLEGDFTQVPESIIENLHLLTTVDYSIIQKYQVPIVRKYDTTKWKIDLTVYYEKNNNMQ